MSGEPGRRPGWDVAATWEGDSSVVRHQPDQDTWFDRAGNFHSEQLNVVERYTPVERRPHPVRRDDDGSKGVHAAVEDHPALYRRLRENAQFLEFKCGARSRRLIYGI